MVEATTGQADAPSAFCRDTGGEACPPCGSRIIGLSFAANAVGPLIKGVVGVLCGSQALVADTVHSLSDTVSFGVNYAGSRTNRLTPFAQSIIIGSITFLAGVWVYTDNAAILFVGERARPGLLGPVVAGLYALVNLYLYSVSACVHRRCGNTGTLLCVMQNKTNCYASGLALVGMVLADLGIMVADPLCAILIGFSLFTTAFEMFKQAFADAPEEARHKRLVFVVVGVLSCAIVALAIDDVLDRNDVILVPCSGSTLESPVDELLGRAHNFLIVNTEKRTVTPVANGYRHFQGDVSDHVIKIVQLRHVDVVLAKTVGREMFDDLQAAGVRIYYVHHLITAAEALASYRSGQYELATAPSVGRGFGRDKVRWLKPW